MTIEQHPLESDLIQFAKGSLADNDFERIAAHLENCDPCAEVLRRYEVAFQPGGIENPPARITEGLGSVIGPYKLLQQIGEGGMGLVYMAEQEKPVRRIVALKIIKPGMDSKQVIARFEAERQALAMMDHNNIARVLDADMTDSGRPYFVMELVKGIPITEFCDQNRLTPLQRLELFVPVCLAIQHAHQKGIIHRDIKPTNVMVTLYDGTPVPKVIDFGIAKATQQKLTERTLFTHLGQILGTLEYMSPEQAEINQLDIDTRSDVYSLGALLYELLTGSTPITKEQLREAGFEEMLRTIRETEPPKPSKRLSDSGKSLPSISAVRNTEPAKLSKLIRGDLDWIVMKALDKQRARRYQTANDLVRDIERYMADEPVEARPPSAMYQLHKFVRKYRRAISIAAGFAFVLCLGGVVSTWQAIRAYRSAESARKAEIQASADRQLAEEKAMAHEQTQAALARERRLFYFNRVVLADRELQSNNIARTKQLLNECPEELRRWEWSYLHGICQQELFSLEHHSPVTAVAFSPDGTLIASGTYDGAIHIWDGMTRQNIRTLTGQSVTISDLAFSPDGQRLVSSVGHESVRHGGIKIWDVPSGQKVADVESVNYGVTSIAISPDGHYMAFVYGTFGTAEITIWDLAAQKPFRVLHGHTGPVSDVAFSPDSQRLVSGGFQQPSLSEDLPGEFRVWNVSTGDELLKQTAPFGPVSTVAYSPDGQFIATSGVDRTLRVWDATTGQERIKLTGHTRDVGCVAFLSQSLLASASHDCSIKLWDPRYEHKSVTLRGHTDFITSLAVDPKRDRVASAGADGTVKLWDTTDEDVFTLRGHEMEVGPVAFSPDGKVLASTGRQGELRIWDADSGLCIYASDPGRFNNAAHSLTFSPDDRSLAALVDGAVWILEAATGRKILECPEKGATATALDFSPDGKTVAALSLGKELNDKGEIRTWNAATGQLVQRFAAHLRVGHKVGCIKYSRDGTRLVTSCTENTARVWDATTGQQIFLLEGHTEPVLGIAISPDDRYIATASDDNYIKLWKLDTGQEVRTLKGHTQDVISVAFSPDGQRLISGANDSMVKLWDVESGEEAITLRGHLGRVRGVAFSRDGERVAAGSEDANIRIWSTVPLTEDMRSRRHAARIVNELASRPLVREDVVTAIQAQENIDTPTRQHALDLATRYQENANFHFNASMSVATRPDATQAEYEAGLRLAESAARLLPNDNSHLNMVGMAKYRVGDYRSAVEILTKTDAVYVKFHEGGVPFNLAYLAMAYHRLGEHDQALRTLDRLDRMMAPPAPEDDSHAESKNESDGTTKPKKWDYTKPEFGLYQSMHKEAAAVLRVGHTIDSANGRGTHRRSEILRRMRIDRWLPKLT